MLDDELLIKYFLDKANILSLEYEEQIKKAFELDMGDYYTEDIANDWLSEDIKILNELVKKNLINKKALELRSQDVPVTLINQVIYGYEDIAKLRFERDTAQVKYNANLEYINTLKLQIRILSNQLDKEYGNTKG